MDIVLFFKWTFFKLTNCFQLDELNTKYTENKKYFHKEEDCFTELNKKWLKNPKIVNTKVCILDEEKNKRFFSLQKYF